MVSFLQRLPRLPLFAFLVSAIPVAAAMFSPDASAARTWTATAERGLAWILVAGVVLLFVRTRFGAENVRTAGQPARKSSAWFWILPAVPMLIHQAWFLQGAYAGLYLADTDFTNISSAISDVLRGGLLRTAYLATGAGESYLGHHFSPGLFAFAGLSGIAEGVGTVLHFRPTHFVYGITLWFVLGAGLSLWTWNFRVRFESHPSIFLFVASLLIVAMIPTWRIAQSFHFEVLVIPAAALVWIGLHHRRRFFWPGIVLWLSVKEDMAAYVLLLGVYLISEPKERRRGWAVLLLALCWGIAGHFLRNWIAGGETPDWGSYWADRWGSQRQWWPSVLMLASVGFLPLFAPRFFVVCLLPVLLLHVLSYHPWHQAYTGHYSYSVLPFLLFGSCIGLRNIADRFGRSGGPIAILLLAVSWFVASNEKESPAGRFPVDARKPRVTRLTKAIPPHACAQAHRRFSPHLPLDVTPFPLIGADGNPWQRRTLPATVPVRDGTCTEWYVLADWSEAQPPYYGKAELDGLRILVEKNYEMVEDGPEADTSVRLYRLR